MIKMEFEKITSYTRALDLLNNFVLISKSYGTSSKLYVRYVDGSILVINKNTKYHISEKEFIDEFSLSSFYIYKNLDEIEIDQEFRKLRQ